MIKCDHKFITYMTAAYTTNGIHYFMINKRVKDDNAIYEFCVCQECGAIKYTKDDIEIER